MPDFGIIEALTAIGTALASAVPEIGAGAAGAGAAAGGAAGAGLGAAATTGLGAGLTSGIGSALTGAGALAGTAGAGLGTAELAASGAAPEVLSEVGTALSGLGTGIGPGVGSGAAATGGIGGIGDALAAASGTAGTSAASLANPTIGGQGLATGIDSAAGGIGGDLYGGSEFGSVLNPDALGATTLPQGPGTADLLPSAGGVGTGAPAPETVGTLPLDLSNQIPAFAPPAWEANAVPASNLGAAIDNPTFGNVGSALWANKDSLAALAPLLANPGALTGENELKDMAGRLNLSSGALSGYLSSGTLPPGLQAGLNSARQSARAAVRSKFASLGMSGSTAETVLLANVDQTTAAQGAELAMKLLDRGIQQQQMSSVLYQQILANAMKEDEQTSAALGRFTAALAA